MLQPINLFEYEHLVQKHVEKSIWDFCQGGSSDEITLRANRKGFERIWLRPRVLREVNSVNLCTTVLGQPVSMPLLVAPTAFHTLLHPDGECATAQATSTMGTVMVASTFSGYRLEEIMAAAGPPLWFQLYLYRDRKVTELLVKRAEDAGYQAIVLTVDTPRLGKRERDLRNSFTLPQTVRIANFEAGVFPEDYIPEPTVATWETVEWLRSITHIPILLKGILTGEDALFALQHDVDGIIVSNHGGRQLDGVLPTIQALSEVAHAVNGRCEIYVDGGIRRGTDILKALALGARAVLIGRPVLWGLAVNGKNGVTHILELLRAELELAMTLAGCSTLAMIDSTLVQYDTFAHPCLWSHDAPC